MPQRIRTIPTFIAACYFAGMFGHVPVSFADENAERLRERANYFESKIRPALIKYCVECHSAETEANGGLLLDSHDGWQAGGDSGDAIVPEHPNKSRLIKAISYEDAKLQMPPKVKLPQETIDAFAKWIADGAYDPRMVIVAKPEVQSGLQVDKAQEHWAYRSLINVTVPEEPRSPADSNVRLSSQRRSAPIDRFIDDRLAKEGIGPALRANRNAIIRRLYFDLTGLPPSASDLLALKDSDNFDETDYERLVDRLLNSTQYGENFARKWMDVARYAESVTLRGFVLPQAWRYRDYLVQAYSEDRPFDQMIREQVAGDLLKHDELHQRQLQLVATGFLAMGNTNLEEQDKAQLEMDYIDEQLDVIGSAFLGQTIGCARCHNHKFDPIPTRDYYAMAGILRSAIALEHDNVSKWIEQPLPIPEAEEIRFSQLSDQRSTINKQIASIKKMTKKELRVDNGMISVKDLAGVVLDNRDAKLVGSWTVSMAVGRFVGDGYIHDENTDKGKKTATFEPRSLQPGNYEVRLSYTASQNRATNAIARVFSADGEATVRINQQQAPPEEGLWFSVGNYRFEKDGQAFVLVTNDQSDGVVIVDAVQFLQVENEGANNIDSPKTSQPQLEPDTQTATRLAKELKTLESKAKKLETELEPRPRYLTVVEKAPAVDIPIHIRGDVHNLGEVVPRGFLTAIGTTDRFSSPGKSIGRIELAEWLSSADHPLTARVYANRVWSWLMGQGIVSSINNFGTTGVAPTHPELLDWLANELIRSGWSTKHLVRTIVLSEAYRRSVVSSGELESRLDPSNHLYWRGHSQRIPVEAIRDAMLTVSGELDQTTGGSSIRSDTKADYNYKHELTRRSIYQPLFRNSLPELFEAFDFADSSVSIGLRPRTTVATQALVLMNHPWVAARAKAATKRYEQQFAGDDSHMLLSHLFLECYGRQPTDVELSACHAFLREEYSEGRSGRLQMLIQSLFAALDFRYIE